MIVRAKAPLRLGLAGGGTDVSPYSDIYGGYVLNTTISQFVYTTIEGAESIQFDSRDLDVVKSFKAEVDLNEANPLILHAAVYNRFMKQFNGGKNIPLKISTLSEAPAGSGLGSSSTLVVSIVAAMAEWMGLGLGEYDLAHLAFEIEREDLKLAGGKQDQYAAAFGGFNFIEFYKDKVIVNPLRVKDWIKDELESSLLLYSTGTSRESARIIEEQIKNVKDKKDSSVEAMHRLKTDALQMKEALLKGQIGSLAEILNQSWLAKKKMAASISNNKIDQIYQAAIENGAIAGKVSGAGGGGFMIFLINPSARLKLSKKLLEFGGEISYPRFYSEGVKTWTLR